MTRPQMTARLIADFAKREKGSRFYAEDLKDYIRHMASRTLDQLTYCFNQMNYRNSAVCQRNDQRAINRMVNAPGYMNMKAL